MLPRTWCIQALVATYLLAIATPAMAHDWSGAPKVIFGIALLQAVPLFFLVGWQMPRSVGLHLVVLAASWPIAVGGLFAFESLWPLLALFAPWAYVVFIAIKRHTRKNEQ